jgi:hypothetical protein
MFAVLPVNRPLTGLTPDFNGPRMLGLTPQRGIFMLRNGILKAQLDLFGYIFGTIVPAGGRGGPLLVNDGPGSGDPRFATIQHPHLLILEESAPNGEDSPT